MNSMQKYLTNDHKANGAHQYRPHTDCPECVPMPNTIGYLSHDGLLLELANAWSNCANKTIENDGFDAMLASAESRFGHEEPWHLRYEVEDWAAAYTERYQHCWVKFPTFYGSNVSSKPEFN